VTTSAPRIQLPRRQAFFARSVRGKLIGIMMLTTVVVLLVSGTAMLVHDLTVYRKSWATDVASEASILALSTAPALAFDDRQAAQRGLNALRSRQAVDAAGLYAANHRLYATYKREAEFTVPPTTEGIAEGLKVVGERVELLQRIEFKGEYLGDLYVVARYDVAGRVRTYLGIFAVTTALSVLAALLFSYILQRIITVPLEEIGVVARRIVQDQDYSLRVKPRTGDEISLVVQALNNMLQEVEDRTAALEQSNAALREGDRKKDEFLATLAHELRNPLAPIRHATRILEAPGATDAQRTWGREVISRQVDQMALLLDDLLDVSRITRGRLELKKDYVPLERIIRNATEIARPLIDAKNHTLKLEIEERSLDLNVDPLRIAQVVANLLTNAAKYTDPGGTITLAAQRESAGLVIRVTDTGIGLTETALSQVFGMFSQVESALERSQGGLGIGLALVKGLVELHGGSVRAESEGLGRGSTFTIYLPHSALVHTPPSHANSETLYEVRSESACCRVLIADDNRDAAKSLAMLLQVSGHEVTTAHSGTEVIELVRHECPDAFILDIGMPGMTGYALAEHIRAQSWGRDVLLVALTGWGAQEDRQRALASGFDRHFTKPVDTKEIEKTLVEFARSRRPA
jgi:signal transduction histidine kinase/ActR/RegA family two-component response regulator